MYGMPLKNYILSLAGSCMWVQESERTPRCRRSRRSFIVLILQKNFFVCAQTSQPKAQNTTNNEQCKKSTKPTIKKQTAHHIHINGSSGGRLITTNNTLTFCWAGWLQTRTNNNISLAFYFSRNSKFADYLNVGSLRSTNIIIIIIMNNIFELLLPQVFVSCSVHWFVICLLFICVSVCVCGGGLYCSPPFAIVCERTGFKFAGIKACAPKIVWHS